MSTNQRGAVVSVNVGTPREVNYHGRRVRTAIFKSPVAGRVAVRRHQVQGDQQADLRVHGGPQKAVYLYPAEHYEYWRAQLPQDELPFGIFGENLTSAGLDETRVRIGDRFRIGSAVLQVSQPRMPCFKLNLRFGRDDMVKRFWLSGKSGIYFSVIEEGDVGGDDPIVQVAAGPEDVTVADVVKLYRGDETDPELLRRALASPLAGGWKEGLAAKQ